MRSLSRAGLETLHDLLELRKEALGQMTVLEDNPTRGLAELRNKLLGLVALSLTKRDGHNTPLLLLSQLLDLIHGVITWGQNEQQRSVS